MMLRPDPKLRHLDMAWSPCRMAEFFNRSVLPAMNDSRQVAEAHLERATYSPGKECFIAYTLRFASAPEEAVRCVVTFADSARLQEAAARQYQAGHNSAVFLAGYSCLVEFFPSDWKLPFLARALDPREMAQVFGDSNRLPQIKVSAYYAHRRCILRYRAGSAEMLGKLYTPGPLVESVSRVMKDVHLQGAIRGLTVPKPLAVVSELLLMEWLPGVPLNRVIEQEEPEQAKAAIRLAAEALSQLHRLRVGSESLRSLESDWERHGQRAGKLGLVAPELAGRVEALREQIKFGLSQFDTHPQVFLHGDYKTSQLLVDGGRIGVVDFDRAGCGDPAIDVGNFMADLHREAVTTGQHFLRDLADEFLAEYQACSPELDNELEARARLMQSLALVRMAMRAFRHSPHTEASAAPDTLAGVLLQEASNCIWERV
jgi:aminoglycoside phosphotransferase (APT) family kinase protein